MSKDVLADTTQPLEAVLVKRQMMLRVQHPNLRLADSLVLKEGPKAYKVVTRWEVVDQHTGEIHHDSLKIETYRRYSSGWHWDEQHSITLQSEEISSLATFLAGILYADIPDHSGHYLIVPARQSDTPQLLHEGTVRALTNLIDEDGVDIFSRLLNWALTTDKTDQLLEKLETLEVDNLQRLGSVVSLGNLKAALAVWDEHQKNGAEDFWQIFLADNPFVFSQIFSFPVIVLGERVYVGGKGISNSGGHVLDFLIANHLTRNVALVEIKTPVSRLLGSQYRGGIYNVNSEISGAVIQVSSYRDSLIKEYDRLAGQSNEEFEVFSPQCMVIAGNLDRELTDRTRRKSFELFRNGLKDVKIVTYDELFNKVRILVELLESS